MEMKPDGSLTGYVGGYRLWETVYKGWVNARGTVIEVLTWVQAYSGAARDQVLADVASEIAQMVKAGGPNQTASKESRATPPTSPIAATPNGGMQDRLTSANPTIPNGSRAAGLSRNARAERDEARQQIESYLTQLQNALQRGVVDREAAMTQMGALLTLTQAAEHDAQYEPHELDSIFERGSEASRIIALGLVQVRPTAASLRISLEATSRPRTPWEQYLGLVVLESLVQTLSTDQKQEVERIIRKQQGGRAGEYITPQNKGRWEVATRILRQVKKRSTGASEDA